LRIAVLTGLGVALLTHHAHGADAPRLIGPDEPRIAYMGRLDRRQPGRPRLGFPGITIRARFEGPSLAVRLDDTDGHSSFAVGIDGQNPSILQCERGPHDYELASNLAEGAHSVDIVKRTEAWQGVVTFLGLRLAPGRGLLEPTPWPSRRLLFIGDSVTAGEGVDRGPTCPKGQYGSSNAQGSYGMLLARALDAQCHLVACGGRGLIRDWQGRRDVLNAPQFFDLALPDEDEPRAVWDHAEYVPDAILVSLGTNDFNLSLGPLPEESEWVEAYVRFLRRIRKSYPLARVFVTEGAIVNDEGSPLKPRTTLRGYLDETVRQFGDPRVTHVEPFHYPGDECDAHPTGAQHRLMALDLEPVLREALGW